MILTLFALVFGVYRDNYFSVVKNSPPITESAEDYLERIQDLEQRKGYARVADIAENLGLKPGSVSGMIQRLARQDYLVYERYRGFRLTAKGQNVARRIQKRHHIVAGFLRLLEIDPVTAFRDTEGIEHHLSAETLKALERLVENAQKNPHTWKILVRSGKNR